MQLNGFLLESVHSPSCELAIVTLRHRYGRGALQICHLSPSLDHIAPLPRHPRTTGTARRRSLAGEPRAAEGGAVQARLSHRPCPVGCGEHLPLDSASASGAPDPAEDAAAQRNRNLELDAQNRLAALFTTRALTT